MVTRQELVTRSFDKTLSLVEEMYQGMIGKEVTVIGGVDREAKQVLYLGRGVIISLEYPHSAVGGLAQEVKAEGLSNPKIKLENNEIIWGCECWWGLVDFMAVELDRMKKLGYWLVPISVANLRKVLTGNITDPEVRSQAKTKRRHRRKHAAAD